MADIRIEDVIRRPLITEKNTILMEHGQYSFEVAPQANKIQIRPRSRQTFNVTVKAVNTLNVKPTQEVAHGQPPWRSHRWTRSRLEEGDRDARPGRADRYLRAGLARSSTEGMEPGDANSQIQADIAGPSLDEREHLRGDHEATPEKSLIEPLKKHAGRNNHGRITTRHRGGGHKRFYRIIDFKRNKYRDSGARSPRSNTTRTARPASPCCTMRMARSATCWRRSG